ncbi:uncharacterized protein LOC143251132 isoform X2 [Tachypleus tridentatus]|uniref:uncharacterized protein LOC143251132 isoform X2 n=1 Tax=Tachypleus tridentatus TaxID=6853 RepID=UPI003FD53F78
MADLTSRMITFSVSRSTSDDHQEHFKNEILQESCSDCQNVLKDMKQIHDELKKYLLEDETARAHFMENVSLWIPTREKNIKYFKKMETHLKTASWGDRISKVSTSASKIGGTMAVVGITLAPVTGGASLGLTAGGAALATAGKIGAGGANMVDLIINKKNCQKLKSTLEKDKQQGGALLENMENLKSCEEKREELLKEIKEFIDILEIAMNVDKSTEEKAVEFTQNLALLEEVTFDSADKVLKKTFINSPVDSTCEEKTQCDEVDLKSPTKLTSQSSGEDPVVAPAKKKMSFIKKKSKDSKK